MELKTKYRKQQEAKELLVYTEYQQLISKPGAMQGAVTEFLMKKHNLHASSTVWNYRKRVEKRLKLNKES